MDDVSLSKKIRIGLQTKSVLVLAVVVLTAAAVGGWLYCLVTADILTHNDRQQADHLARGLAVSAANELGNRNREGLQRLAMDLLGNPDAHYVAVLDRGGKVMAKAERVSPGAPPFNPLSQPVSLSYDTPYTSGFLELGRPIILDGAEGQDILVGAVRLVMDTRQTGRIIAGVGRQVVMIAAIIVLGVIPLGHLLVLRVLVVPIRRLVRVTRRLADGDYAVRADAHGNDEIGELSEAFDAMIGQLNATHRQLRLVNESLEQKVAQRTTELEQANRRLREEMVEKEDFLRAVSHDLNAPLRNIAGMAAMITTKWRGQLPEDVLARLGRIQANVDNETDLLNELLELSRIRTRPQKREWVDLGQLLGDLRGAFEYELRQKHIALSLNGPMPRLHVEKTRFREVFQNLIDNAIKYMPARPDGRIDIAYRLQGQAHHFTVSDNGPGIAPEDQQRVFFVFRRGFSPATVGVPGKGVGLALVKTIVSNYQGRIWVESCPPEGSTFHVELPSRTTSGASEGSSHDEAAKPAAVSVAG